LNDLQERGHLVRRYLAWVDGSPREDAGTVSHPLGRDPHFDYRRAVVPVADGGQEAVTHWRVRERRADRSLLELDLDTGRTHQIRVHLASLGHPICGDLLYSRTPVAGQRGAFSATRIALHSWQVSFAHPTRPEQRVELTSPPAPDFDSVSS
jgi:23S rRNA pseudouridine1911/1915/1917 synthase